ncbi:MAG: hypothetical protein DRP86_06125 [Candidatus Neomarinimicrobiota bacterium]|nr:MAG: hypothetical protein DRP86_06125 [Candidatus Neomarinimicrobiota bacterium]
MENFIRSVNVGKSIVYFGIFGILLWIFTWFGIPLLQKYSGLETVYCWFILGGIGVFLPMLITAVIKTRRDGFKDSAYEFYNRLRLTGFRSGDILWILFGTLISGAGTVLILEGMSRVGLPLTLEPPFLNFTGFPEGKTWYLAFWIPFFLLNTFGEELLWRGYLLPRQVTAFGKSGWILNAGLWFFFHAAFGFDLMILLLPIFIIVPWFTYIRKNTWVGIAIHGMINGLAFIALSLNWI